MRYGAIKVRHHSYWTRAVEPRGHNDRARVPRPTAACSPWGPCSATREATAMKSPYTTGEKPSQQQGPRTVKNKLNKILQQKKLGGIEGIVMENYF